MTAVMEEMLRCLDTQLAVFTFGKTHRPEEIAKIAASRIRLRDLQVAYPASWRALQRRIGAKVRRWQAFTPAKVSL